MSLPLRPRRRPVRADLPGVPPPAADSAQPSLLHLAAAVGASVFTTADVSHLTDQFYVPADNFKYVVQPPVPEHICKQQYPALPSATRAAAVCRTMNLDLVFSAKAIASASTRKCEHKDLQVL